jgi:hypothetical protein
MRRAIGSVATATLLLLVASVPVTAQPPGPRQSAFQVRLGVFMPTADSDFWDANKNDFTLSGSDFDSFMLGFTYVHPYSNYVEIGFNFDFYEETASSQYREYFDFGPVYHDTTLTLMPLTADVRFIPGGRYRVRPGGRHIVKPVFYIGAGAGLTFWEYEEVGEFVCEDDLGFFPCGDRLLDDNVTFELHALAGVEVPVGRWTNLLFEGRYSVAEDDLSGDFAGFALKELDVGGSSIFGGLSFRF